MQPIARPLLEIPLYGFVYVAYCDAFPTLYKIGSTRAAPSERLRQLGHPTSAPSRFELVCVAEFDDPEIVEREIHRLWADCRYNPRREFFELPPKDLQTICDWLEEHGNFAWSDAYRLYHAKEIA
jgi:hypothetical protein